MPPPTRREIIHQAIDAITAATATIELMVVELRKTRPDVAQLAADLGDVFAAMDRLAAIFSQLWNLPDPRGSSGR